MLKYGSTLPDVDWGEEMVDVQFTPSLSSLPFNTAGEPRFAYLHSDLAVNR